METNAGLKWHVVGASLVATVLGSGGCALMEPQAERYVAPPIGSTYTIRQQNTGAYGQGERQLTITVGERTWQGNRFISFSSQAQTILSTPEGRWPVILFPGSDRVMFRYDPPIGFEWPLAVGKSWSNAHRMTTPDNRTIPMQVDCKVESYGDVTVPAATLKAFKVACANSIGQSDVYWFSSDLGVFVKQSSRNSASHPFGAGTREGEMLSHTIRQ